MIAAIILAGGKSERMGSPKALLRYEGCTFLERILHTLEGVSVDYRLVVAGRHAAEISECVPSVRVVFNPDYERGMTTSFQAGIRALPEGVHGTLVCLVDHPLVRPETVEALIRREGQGEVIVPRFQGRRGHPILISPAFMAEVEGLSPDRGVNELVRVLGAGIVEVEVLDPGILADIDTREDYRRLVEGGSPGERRN